jgi:hypothetical protein
MTVIPVLSVLHLLIGLINLSALNTEKKVCCVMKMLSVESTISVGTHLKKIELKRLKMELVLRNACLCIVLSNMKLLDGLLLEKKMTTV